MGSQFLPLHPGGELLVGNGEDLTKRFIKAHGKDWALLDRNEIIPVDENGQETTRPEQEEHHLANYGGQGGSWRELLGRHSWFLLHFLAAKYPEYPKPEDQQAMR